jgi:hypothetical protein
MRDIMHNHRCNQARVVNLLSEDQVLNDKLLPFWKDVACVGQDSEEVLQLREFLFGLSNRKSQSIVGNRSRGYSPELNQVLRYYE